MWKPSLEDLNASFASVDLRRGRSYASEGRVLWLESRTSGRELDWLGEVRGSRRRPYRVHVRAFKRDQGWRLEAHCTCPIQVACKHAAALLWHATRGESSVDSLGLRSSSVRLLQPTPSEGRVGLILDGIGAGVRQIALRIGRWIAAPPPQRWRFEEFQALAGRSDALASSSASVRALVARLADQRASFYQGHHWYLLPEADWPLVWAAIGEGLVAWQQPGRVLQQAEPRGTRWQWTIDGRGRQRLAADAGPEAEILACGRLWYYVHPLSHRLGALDPRLDGDIARRLLSMRPLEPEAVAEFDASYRAHYGEVLKPPRSLEVVRVPPLDPVPVLTLHQSAGTLDTRGQRGARLIAYARLSFVYGMLRIGEDDPSEELSLFEDDRVQRLPRRRELERGSALRMKQLGLISNRHAVIDHPGLKRSDWLINPDGDPQTLNEFCYVLLPKLRREGWRIEYGPRFPLKLIDTEYSFYADLHAHGPDRIGLELGIDMEGERINLIPLLREGLRAAWFQDLPAASDAIVALRLPGERRLPIAAGRLRFLLQTLNELSESGSSDQRRLELPRVRAAVLIELESELGEGRRLWQGAEEWRALAGRLARYSGLPAVAPPPALQATLRPYQIEGLAWMRFLHEQGLSGILADDMGLGKTVQVIAHLLALREAAAAATPPVALPPSLVVCPKSVLPNWQAELARFAPQLKVLALAGSDRQRARRQLAQADVVLTTYPVLAREVEALAAQRFELVVLDESQMVKNPATLAARAARKLDAAQRLCLTGTPLENHLGEFWAQFDFLLPGLLGSKTDFTSHFRTPIEKRRDLDARERLRRRTRPFLLRRSKDQVIADLPAKTEVTRSIDMEGRQRDLYDTLRASYMEEIRGYVASNSLDRNRLRVLEALLRLRQICCDPRLTQMAAAQGAPSAKLDVLVDMLQSLSAAGRRILVFSQFTSMLELIEQELARARLRYVKLTGQTEDRATPVQRFQRGEVPIFLISLRAGGFGLNLTAADTVIHFDPWWNPAVEAQATDRAHRIGQDKPVFVYRLMAAHSVEQRIEELKGRKRELASSLFDDSGQNLMSELSADDWLSLFD